jgi:hypothetical protein
MTTKQKHVRLMITAVLLVAGFFIVGYLLWAEFDIGRHNLYYQLSYLVVMTAIFVALTIVLCSDAGRTKDRQE